MKSILKKITLVLLTALILGISFAAPAYAENVCKQISGTSKNASTFMVETTSRWLASKDVLKLTQTKGIMNIERVKLTKNVKDTREMYETYTVKVEKMVKGKVKSTKTYTWSGSSLKIKLEKNSTYRVTVTSYFVKYNGKYPGGSLFNPYDTKGISALSSAFWAPRGWKKHSTWKVSSTKGILSCK